jgi:hypothetical protein
MLIFLINVDLTMRGRVMMTSKYIKTVANKNLRPHTFHQFQDLASDTIKLFGDAPGSPTPSIVSQFE